MTFKANRAATGAATPEFDSSSDGSLAREIAALPGPLKAKLVMDYLGLSSGANSEKFPELATLAVPEKKAHDFRLIHGLLTDLTKEFKARPKDERLKASAPPLVPENPQKPARTSKAPNQSIPDSTPNIGTDLGREHPRIAALLLSTLDTPGAAKALRKLDRTTSRRLALNLNGLEGSASPVAAPVMQTILQHAG